MARFNVQLAPNQRRPEIFRVIDDGDCVLTTLDPYKALAMIQKVLDKNKIDHCWVDFETLR